MSTIDITLGGVTVSARLLEHLAPKTCAALQRALPLSQRWVHTVWSGNMIQSLDPIALDVDEVESPLGLQYPRLVMYCPSRQQLAIAYGDARYRYSAGPEYVTPVAELQGDLDDFIKEAARIQFEGADTLKIAPGTLVPVPAREEQGTKIQIEVDGAVITATLLEETAPKTCAVFKKLLPVTSQLINTKWSGAMAHFWGGSEQEGRATRGSFGLYAGLQENPTVFHQPGHIYHHEKWGGIRICYGDGQQGGAFSHTALTPIARFDGDWSAFKEKAEQIQERGALRMTIRVKE